AQDLPLQGHHVGHQHFVDNIDRFYCCADTAEKLIISGGVFTFENRQRPEEATLANHCRRKLFPHGLILHLGRNWYGYRLPKHTISMCEQTRNRKSAVPIFSSDSDGNRLPNPI